MKAGEGAGNFLADLANGIDDGELRERWKRGDYGPLRADFVKDWRRLVGRNSGGE